jgi:type II secretory pathway component GspD/PulD (secretin)
MEELAFQYGLEIYEKGNTVYALTKAQMGELPSKEWMYQLRYLRPDDFEAIKSMVTPYLSPGSGIVNYEPKTNTVVVIDTPQNIDRIESFFKKIDKPQGQVVVEVKILSVNSNAAGRLGTDWTTTLGRAGLNLSSIANLNSIFGIDAEGASFAEQALAGDSDFVLAPAQLSGVLRALNQGGLVKQMSNPVVITEDNEEAVVSLIDRVPIITRTVTQGTGATTVSEEVRYVLEEGDATGDPATNREIGITMTVTPQILPDGTIRMEMRPRSAEIVEEVIGVDGNRYPRVSEATIDIKAARIPDGHSLIVGGFFTELETENSSKIPLLGDIPILNFFFKSDETDKETASLIFVVTPTSYLPENEAENYRQHMRIQRSLTIPPDHDSINPDAPGRAHESNYCRQLEAIQADINRDVYPNRYPPKR